MDFIERWFHVAPDGGDGSLEALCLALAVVALAAVWLHRRVRRAPAPPASSVGEEL